MDEHLVTEDLHEPLQSAYTANHSTETALLKVTNDILLSLDERKCVLLVLLDLSAAFDTIDHNVFLARLTNEYGITGDVRDWMGSYLRSRQQVISINSSVSDKIVLDFGFPQGSCIGPFGFKLYTKPLTEIAAKHNVHIHLYADDTQLYVPFNPDDSEEALNRIESCIEEIRSWMQINFLKLNDSKTEFLIIGGKKDLERVKVNCVKVGDSDVLPSTSARNIGAYLDNTMDMKDHIAHTIRSCYYQIRLIAKIRKFLTMDSAKKIVHAFVSSRLDSLNSLLVKLPDCQLNRLQVIQNSAARLVTNNKKSCNITPVLKELHWLPVEHRIDYKILLLVYKCLCGEGPVYLRALLEEYSPAKDLRSSTQCQLRDCRVQKVYGSRAFGVAGPRLWNKLPLHIKNSPTVDAFKTAIKTHFFNIYFNADSK
jgi:hypothetical protein